jgi:hypothetical protein
MVQSVTNASGVRPSYAGVLQRPGHCGSPKEYTSLTDPPFVSSRQRVIAAGEPLLAAAQRAGHIHDDVTLVQALDIVLGVVRLDRDRDQIETILQVALDGLRAHQR